MVTRETTNIINTVVVKHQETEDTIIISSGHMSLSTYYYQWAYEPVDLLFNSGHMSLSIISSGHMSLSIISSGHTSLSIISSGHMSLSIN